MTPALLALTLALADPLGFPSPAAAAQVAAAPAPAAPAATAARPLPPPPLSLPAAPGSSLDGLILPVAALLALAVAALLATRRRQRLPRLVQVLETTSIGPKRALVVARVGDEVMVIGSSEAGLQLLAARPSGLEARAAEAPARLVAVPDVSAEPEQAAGPVLGFLARLGLRSAAGLGLRSAGGLGLRSAAGLADRRPGAGGAAPTGEAQAFDALLAESSEDQELRRKLALGHPGSVR